ncbi:MAG: glycosyltransferase family 4 protein [Propionibacteriaceae bacterium]|nr:glycosyltransferase family 4 protein [Propionibacteriaceae bacterium]
MRDDPHERRWRPPGGRLLARPRRSAHRRRHVRRRHGQPDRCPGRRRAPGAGPGDTGKRHPPFAVAEARREPAGTARAAGGPGRPDPRRGRRLPGPWRLLPQRLRPHQGAGYRERGHDVTVFVVHRNAETSYREYQGITVVTGSPAALQDLLDTGHFDHVLVHFLNRFMWQALGPVRGKIPITVFVHGFEVQPYWRREYAFRSRAEREAGVAASDLRMALWREVAASAADDVTYVFVSRDFRERVGEDFRSLGFDLPAESVRVVSNPVDTNLFSYEEKDPELRKKILLIRPFRSRTYANDLAAEAIVELSREPWFPELSFRIIGDGVLFDEVTEPLRGLPNVVLERRFLPQAEIAELHKEHGVFLVPTRHDTQGVSRDEAMSSGLVPVTSGLPVISEFLSDEEGYIAPPDDAQGLADAIRHLYHHPEAFVAKSRAAAARIRRTVASSIVIPQEIALFHPSAQADETPGER